MLLVPSLTAVPTVMVTYQRKEVFLLCCCGASLIVRWAQCTALTITPDTVFVGATCLGIVTSPKACIVSPAEHRPTGANLWLLCRFFWNTNSHSSNTGWGLRISSSNKSLVSSNGIKPHRYIPYICHIRIGWGFFPFLRRKLTVELKDKKESMRDKDHCGTWSWHLVSVFRRHIQQFPFLIVQESCRSPSPSIVLASNLSKKSWRTSQGLSVTLKKCHAGL